jgi:calcineurin-like phosphoesterase family protein
MVYMSIQTFIIADTHFGHQGVCSFLAPNGEKLRPWDSAEEMDEALVTLWNETVRPMDNVIHLGDVAMSKRHVATIGRCHGRKVLVKGNHDKFSLDTFVPLFDNIHGALERGDFILTHVPVHESEKHRFKGNIHGHLHAVTLDDPWFQCVSAEQIGFKPILLDEVMSRCEI